MEAFKYGSQKLTVANLIEIASEKRRALLDSTAKSRIKSSFDAVGAILEKGEPVYGVNTGFGSLCRTVIPREKTDELQVNLLKSHACGVGEPVEPFVVKMMLISKVHSLALGYSGVSLETVERIIWHIENDCLPYVPSKGSVGASGDLAPLAHLFLPLIGLGKVFYKGELLDAGEVLKREGLKPIKLHPKEGLALINGTQFMSAHAAFGLYRFKRYLDFADVISAMTIEALKGSLRPFNPRLHALRAHNGAVYVAQRIWSILRDSEIVRSHEHCSKVQDPYSLRCIPQIHGAAREAFLKLKSTLEVELNSVTDNPVIIDEETVISGGNFHGELLALPVDYAALAASEMSSVADRRVYLLLAGDGDEVPKMLLEEVGVNSGFMITQYLTAALASENKTLSFPASADSIPTSLGQEDHVSMGSISVRKFNKILDNLSYVLAVELLLAAQALEFRRPLKSTETVEFLHGEVRKRVSFARRDRVFSEDIEAVHELIEDDGLIEEIDAQIRVDYALKEKFEL